MFPQIAKKKKKDFIVEEIITKQWEQALRDLQIKSKMALKRIPNSILQDFGKVCRIKSIPEFYADYFICSTYKLEEEQLSQIYAEEIQRILTNSSYFHKINQALRQREELIEGLKNSLIIVEGFLLMNQNKSIPLQIKTSIDSFVNDCATLEEIKDLQRKKTEELAKDIIRIRTNTTQLLQLVGQWRQDLIKYSKNEKKIKMIYPHQAINCLLMPLYDLLFLKNSVLKSEVTFGKDQHDPFLQKISKSKKGTQIQNYFLDYLKADTTDYSSFVTNILQQLPSQQSDRLREKQLQIQRKREQKAKQQKLKEQKLRLLRQEKQKQIRIKHSTSLKTFKPIQKEQINRNANSKTSKGERSQRKIINIDKIMRQKSIKKAKVNQNGQVGRQSRLNDNDSKVLGAYKKMKKKQFDQSILLDKTELIQEKKIWQKQIKEEKQQKQKIRKILRQTQKKAIIQTKLFQEKLKRYQQQVQNLKNRVDQSKKIVRVTSSIDKSKGPSSPQKVKKIIISAYKSQTRPKDSRLQVLQQKLIEESKSKLNLQKQIKELAKQKLKLQKLMERQNTKATKEVETNKKKIEKYEEVINKLKKQTESSHKIIHELQFSKQQQERKNEEALRNSIIKQKQVSLKKNIQEKIEEKEKKKSAYSSIKLEKPKIIHSKKKSLQGLNEKNQQSSINKSKFQMNDPKLQILKQKLEEQSRSKRSLQSQIKELAQQKIKLQKFIERQNTKANKQGQKNSKRIQKYQETINRLKQETQESRRIINQIESSKIFEQKKSLEKSRVQSVKKKEDQLRRKIQQKIQQRQKRKAQKAKAQQLNKSHEKRSNIQKNYKSQTNKNYSNEDIEIIKTKQTIEIVFEPKKRKSHQSKQLLQAQSKLLRLQKQRDLLERKLELSRSQKRQKAAQANNKKISEKEQIADKFKDQIEKQRQKNYRLEQNLRKMRKNINSEYQLKLNKEKMKYQKERQELLKAIEKQRQEKRSKDKILQQQMLFLRQMQKKQNQLFQLLQHQKREKLKKEQILTREIQQKQELMSMIQLQEIKKGIERQVRKQIEQNQYEQNDQDILHQQRKMELQQQIQHLRMEKQNEIQQMNDQNEKLRGLIAQIKAEQTNLLEAIKENIEMESDTQRQFTDVQENNQVSKQSQEKNQENKFQNLQKHNQNLSKELQSKTMIQFRNQQRKKNEYANIQKSQLFKDKQKIQNLVQFYLKSPQYPGQKKQVKIEQVEKRQIIKNSAQKAKQIQKFQTQLFSLRDLPQYVPSLKNDSLTNHLLNLRDAYDDYQADALRRQLFPPLQQEVYQQKELSYESQYPMNTLMDHVRDHMRNHPKKQQKNKKNFLAINRVRLAVLQQNRKEKQRILIEQQSRRKIQKQLFDKRRKERQQNFQRQKEKQLQEKEKKREQIYKKEKKRAQKQQRSLQKHKQEKLKKNKHKEEKSIEKSKQSKEKHIENKKYQTKKSDSQRQSKEKSKDKKKNSIKNQSSSDSEGIKSQNQKQKQIQNIQAEQIMQTIKEQHSLQQKEAEIVEQVKQFEKQLKNRQRDLLKQQIKLVQQEVRTFINEQQHYQIYQQFINENQLLDRVQQLLDLSSEEIRKLNSNLTIKDDVPLHSTLALLIAKNSKGIQIGLGVFHKEFQHGEYVCDYLIAHNMENFLNLAFNFSRYLFKKDIYAKKIEFIFNIKSVSDPNTLKHFLQFQKKCRRLGQVYLKARSQSERKYVLRRSLFEAVEQNSSLNETGGIDFKLSLAFCGELLKQINQGFKNKSNPNYSSYNVVMAYYLSKKEEKLFKFRQRAESQLLYRQLLVTSLLFQKKEVEIKNFALTQYKKKNLTPIIYAQNKVDLIQVDEIQEMKLSLQQKLPQFTKRCTLQVGFQQINYLLLSPQQATTVIQSSNSSQTGYFLSIVPKYKLMIIQAQEFLTMSAKNADLTAFFYIKHFIKNIVDVKKEKYQRIYIPQIHMQNEFYFPEISKKIRESMFLSENIEIGWKTQFPNSVIYTPRHQDLVIQRPFIVALLSGNVQRAVQGSPICVEVIM